MSSRSIRRKIIGESVQQKILNANAAFALIGALLLWFTPLRHDDWLTNGYLVIILGVMLVATGIGLWQRHRRGEKLFNREQDLDRPGGPYDHLHGRR